MTVLKTFTECRQDMSTQCKLSHCCLHPIIELPLCNRYIIFVGHYTNSMAKNYYPHAMHKKKEAQKGLSKDLKSDFPGRKVKNWLRITCQYRGHGSGKIPDATEQLILCAQH